MTTALIRDIKHGLMSDFSGTEFPSKVFGFVAEDSILEFSESGTIFGYVWRGRASISTPDATRVINEGYYFSIPTTGKTSVSGATGFFVLRLGYSGLPLVGGPVEKRGRLKYIDGCSDSLLISPPLRGDPCFNLLHFPKGIDQTRHTHSSIRAGLIHEGMGYCHMESGTESLSPGKVFILYPDAIHAFSTKDTDGMTLTVFHPDSDFGPTHEEHPMLNRTFVDGVSARHLDEIRTREIV